MLYSIKLEWKAFNINVKELHSQLKSLSQMYLGPQSGLNLELFFSEEPSQEDKDAILALWDSIDSDQHALAQSYVSAADIQADAEAKKQSAKAKLSALGLTEAELKALLGV